MIISQAGFRTARLLTRLHDYQTALCRFSTFSFVDVSFFVSDLVDSDCC